MLSVTTPPAPPASCTTSNRNYCNVTLQWPNSSGAKGYYVYNESYNLITSSLITTNSYTVNGLSAGTTYKFYITSYSDAGGISEYSPLVTTSTLAIPTPIISGPNAVCYSGATFTATNLPSDCALVWDKSPGISLSSASGSSATFVAIGQEKGYVRATFNPGCGSKNTDKPLTVGAPRAITDIILYPTPPLCLNQYTIATVRSRNVDNTGITYEWWGGSHEYNSQNQWNSEVHFTTLPLYSYNTNIYVTANNECGSSNEFAKILIVNDCGGGIAPVAPVAPIVISPNPASSSINVAFDNLTNNTSQKAEAGGLMNKLSENAKSTTYTIQISDNYGVTKLTTKRSGTTFTIPINNLKDGIYIIKISDGKNAYSERFVVKH